MVQPRPLRIPVGLTVEHPTAPFTVAPVRVATVRYASVRYTKDNDAPVRFA